LNQQYFVDEGVDKMHLTVKSDAVKKS